MERSNYVPSVYARGMTLTSVKIIGIILTEIDDLYAANAVAYLEAGLKRRGYDIIIYSTGSEINNAGKYISSLTAKKADAVIMVGSKFESRVFADELRRIRPGIPLIMINSFIDLPGIYSVVADDKSAVYDIVVSLYSRDDMRFIYLYDSESPSGTRKLKGFKKAVEDNAITGYEIVRCSKDIGISKRMVISLLKDHGCRYSIICSDDLLAIGAIKACEESGFDVPGDVSVVGYDDSILAVSSTPELTSVNCKLGEICSKSIDILMDILSGRDAVRKTQIKCEIVKRQTTV